MPAVTPAPQVNKAPFFRDQAQAKEAHARPKTGTIPHGNVGLELDRDEEGHFPEMMVDQTDHPDWDSLDPNFVIPGLTSIHLITDLKLYDEKDKDFQTSLLKFAHYYLTNNWHASTLSELKKDMRGKQRYFGQLQKNILFDGNKLGRMFNDKRAAVMDKVRAIRVIEKAEKKKKREAALNLNFNHAMHTLEKDHRNTVTWDCDISMVMKDAIKMDNQGDLILTDYYAQLSPASKNQLRRNMKQAGLTEETVDALQQASDRTSMIFHHRDLHLAPGIVQPKNVKKDQTLILDTLATLTLCYSLTQLSNLQQCCEIASPACRNLELKKSLHDSRRLAFQHLHRIMVFAFTREETLFNNLERLMTRHPLLMFQCVSDEFGNPVLSGDLNNPKGHGGKVEEVNVNDFVSQKSLNKKAAEIERKKQKDEECAKWVSSGIASSATDSEESAEGGTVKSAERPKTAEELNEEYMEIARSMRMRIMRQTLTHAEDAVNSSNCPQCGCLVFPPPEPSEITDSQGEVHNAADLKKIEALEKEVEKLKNKIEEIKSTNKIKTKQLEDDMVYLQKKFREAEKQIVNYERVIAEKDNTLKKIMGTQMELIAQQDFLTRNMHNALQGVDQNVEELHELENLLRELDEMEGVQQADPEIMVTMEFPREADEKLQKADKNYWENLKNEVIAKELNVNPNNVIIMGYDNYSSAKDDDVSKVQKRRSVTAKALNLVEIEGSCQGDGALPIPGGKLKQALTRKSTAFLSMIDQAQLVADNQQLHSGNSTPSPSPRAIDNAISGVGEDPKAPKKKRAVVGDNVEVASIPKDTKPQSGQLVVKLKTQGVSHNEVLDFDKVQKTLSRSEKMVSELESLTGKKGVALKMDRIDRDVFEKAGKIQAVDPQTGGGLMDDEGHAKSFNRSRKKHNSTAETRQAIARGLKKIKTGDFSIANEVMQENFLTGELLIHKQVATDESRHGLQIMPADIAKKPAEGATGEDGDEAKEGDNEAEVAAALESKAKQALQAVGDKDDLVDRTTLHTRTITNVISEAGAGLRRAVTAVRALEDGKKAMKALAAQKQREIETFRDEIAALCNELRQKDDEFAEKMKDLLEQLEQRDAQLAEAEKMKSELAAKLESVSKELAGYKEAEEGDDGDNGRVAELEARVKFLENENANLRLSLEELKSRIEELEKLIASGDSAAMRKNMQRAMRDAGLQGDETIRGRSVFERLYQDARNRLQRLATLQKKFRAAMEEQQLLIMQGSSFNLFPTFLIEEDNTDVDNLTEFVLESLGVSVVKDGRYDAWKKRFGMRPWTASDAERNGHAVRDPGVAKRQKDINIVQRQGRPSNNRYQRHERDINTVHIPQRSEYHSQQQSHQYNSQQGHQFSQQGHPYSQQNDYPPQRDNPQRPYSSERVPVNSAKTSPDDQPPPGARRVLEVRMPLVDPEIHPKNTGFGGGTIMHDHIKHTLNDTTKADKRGPKRHLLNSDAAAAMVSSPAASAMASPISSVRSKSLTPRRKIPDSVGIEFLASPSDAQKLWELQKFARVENPSVSYHNFQFDNMQDGNFQDGSMMPSLGIGDSSGNIYNVTQQRPRRVFSQSTNESKFKVTLAGTRIKSAGQAETVPIIRQVKRPKTATGVMNPLASISVHPNGLPQVRERQDKPQSSDWKRMPLSLVSESLAGARETDRSKAGRRPNTGQLRRPKQQWHLVDEEGVRKASANNLRMMVVDRRLLTNPNHLVEEEKKRQARESGNVSNLATAALYMEQMAKKKG